MPDKLFLRKFPFDPNSLTLSQAGPSGIMPKLYGWRWLVIG